MKRIGSLCVAVVALSLAACADDAHGPVGLADASAVASNSDNDGLTRLGFVSRNLYIGTNLDPVVQALASPTLADDVPALIGAINDINATDWPARVVAIADEIEKEKPQVIALQEAWDVNVNLAALGLNVVVDLDFLASLEAELARRGLNYQTVASFSGVTAAPFPGISVIDRDVLLVDPSRVTVDAASVTSAAFLANIGAVAPGVVVRRGWVAIDATIDGETMRLVSTHLESGQGAALTQLRAFQTGQLMQVLAAAPRAVVMGDFNDTPTSPMYGLVSGAGFADVWRAMRPGVEGYTCCHAEVLDNARAQDAFTQRIDYIFVRGFSADNGRLLGRVALLGTTAEDRLQGPSWMLWPSDHAGLALELLVTP
jgi:hypothetical protein